MKNKFKIILSLFSTILFVFLFFCDESNPAGNNTKAPIITSHPSEQSVTEGQTSTFSVTATGSNLQYQWQKDAMDISGAILPTYTIPATEISDSGSTYRCVVWNSADTVISEEAVLTVYKELITDIDGNVYQTVRIGNQLWTSENLRTTKYNDGTDIPHVTDGTEWEKLSTGAYCYYNNTTNADSIKKFGALYNWYSLETGKLAPAGWHVPTDEEWTELEEYLIANGYNWDGTTTGDKIAKSMAAKTDWRLSDDEGDVGNDLQSNNSSGFSALPGGFRYYDGSFNYQGLNGRWWSATENNASNAYHRSLLYNHDNLNRDYNNKEYGFSVRLVRDIDY